MRKAMKLVSLCIVTAVFVWLGFGFRDRQTLKKELIRLHVVAHSNSDEDQAVKLRVKDAITGYLAGEMAGISDTEQAKAYLQENLLQIEQIANRVLQEAGSDHLARVTLAQESFGIRHYDTFTLPSGVYEALRITIGEGQGKNWWCVVFPSLCLPATAAELESVAVGSGFSEGLIKTLEGAEGYQIRFYLLEILGKIENNFWDKEI